MRDTEEVLNAIDGILLALGLWKACEIIGWLITHVSIDWG